MTPETIPITQGRINSPVRLFLGNVNATAIRFSVGWQLSEVRRIQDAVVTAFALPEDAMTTPNRAQHIAWPRQIAMALCCEVKGLTTVLIGAAFGGRDHGTVIHARKEVAKRVELYAFAREQVGELRRRLAI
jgi:chromosomal replication initiator protein